MVGGIWWKQKPFASRYHRLWDFHVVYVRRVLGIMLELFGRVGCRWPFWGNHFKPSRVELPAGGIFCGHVEFRSPILAAINFETSRMSGL